MFTCKRCGAVMEFYCVDFSEEAGSEWLQCPNCDMTCNTKGREWEDERGWAYEETENQGVQTDTREVGNEDDSERLAVMG